jgi:hypothetical protein
VGDLLHPFKRQRLDQLGRVIGIVDRLTERREEPFVLSSRGDEGEHPRPAGAGIVQ